ncbi:DUF2062 domain-containing protein [Kaistella palustris]|uniref:DUF2062 domain-containing protein n=1 Tax=Kaistella palustris TaxID=493376 RepID=UPI00040A2ACF|nr:DUF2062 domain-containing protein [Kaistella palustris]
MKNIIKNTIQSQKVFYRYFRKKGFKRFLKENILESEGSSEVKAKSVALGVLIGLSPIWGFHMVAVLFLASYLKLNRAISYMCTHVSFPPFIPFIILLSMIVGAPFTGGHADFAHETLDFSFIKRHLLQYLVGSLILAVSCSAIFGFATYYFLEKFGNRKSMRNGAGTAQK